MILSICDNLDILRILRIVKTAILLIKIVVPIILIVSCMIEVISIITSNDVEISAKLLKSWVRKVIAALLIFLIPTFINLLADLGSADTNEIAKCFQNSTNERIEELTIEQAKKYIVQAKESLSNPDYYVANRMVNKIKTDSVKNELTKELELISSYISMRNEIYELAKKYDSEKYKSLKAKLEAISDEKIRERLLKEFEENVKSRDIGWWWPVGSKQTTTLNGVTYAEGEPATTRITAYFGGNDAVHKGLGGGHGAIDIGAYRDNVIASKSGTVVYPGKNDRIDYPDQAIKPDENGKYNCAGLNGNYVKIDHGDGITTLYQHLYKNTITVRAGDHVEQGQVIGISGSSGCSSGPHLHFQMELNGTRIDPLNYVSSSNPRP